MANTEQIVKGIIKTVCTRWYDDDINIDSLYSLEHLGATFVDFFDIIESIEEEFSIYFNREVTFEIDLYVDYDEEITSLFDMGTLTKYLENEFERLEEEGVNHNE